MTFLQRWRALSKDQKTALCNATHSDRSYLSAIANGRQQKFGFCLARCLAADLDTTVESLFPGKFTVAPLSVNPNATPKYVNSLAQATPSQNVNKAG